MAFESYSESFILLVFCFIFLAGLVDAIAGGGGLIAIPVLMIAFPNAVIAHIFGTNRFASFLGTATAAYQYNKNKPADLKLILYAGIPAAIMAGFGVLCSHYISTTYFKPMVIILLLAVIIFSVFRKDFGNDSKEKKYQYPNLYASLFGGSIGFYNGIFGPGTGTFLLFGLVGLLGYNLLNASSVSKILNVVVDGASLIYFIIIGAVVFKLAIPMAICNIAGGYVGSKIAIKKGNRFIRYVFLAISMVLVVKLAYDYFSN
jgi:uncharacterized protein